MEKDLEERLGLMETATEKTINKGIFLFFYILLNPIFSEKIMLIAVFVVKIYNTR